MRFLDQDILDLLLEEIRHSGMEVLLNSPHEKVEKLPDGRYKVTMKDGSFVEAHKVIQAIGRPPLTSGLGLENTRVNIDDKSGHILTDEFQNTT